MQELIIVSDMRLIEANQSVFFNEVVESIDLGKIQDMQTHKTGFWCTILDYGDVYFTFANILDTKIMRYVPQPHVFIENVNKIRRRLIFKSERLDQESLIPSGIVESEEIVI